MKVTVNELTVELFEGAQVKNAVLRYFTARKMDKSLINDDLPVKDAYGHTLDLNAPLRNEQCITVQTEESL